jgi:hypothetical protein
VAWNFNLTANQDTNLFASFSRPFPETFPIPTALPFSSPP